MLPRRAALLPEASPLGRMEMRRRMRPASHAIRNQHPVRIPTPRSPPGRMEMRRKMRSASAWAGRAAACAADTARYRCASRNLICEGGSAG